MSFLPIVQRELNVAARRRSTFRIRWWTTTLAIVFTLFAVLLVESSPGRAGKGSVLFGIICWYAFFLSLLSGVFLTADCLSVEKREGTLGLLFLSDLKGYDVVFGKFIALAVHAFYCLLALVPAAALSILFGGVTGGQLWRTILALGNILFFSMALGMLVSARSHDAHRSFGNTLASLLLVIGGLPSLGSLGNWVNPSPWWHALSSLSPLYPVAHLADGQYLPDRVAFWTALLISALVGCALLGAASWVLPRAWQRGTEVFLPARPPHIRSPVPRFRRVRTTQWNAEGRTRNPVEQLVREQLGCQWLAWIIVVAWGILSLIAMMMGLGSAPSSMISAYTVLPFAFLLKLLFAMQATRFFTEGRRTGALHLLLCTPLSSREIVRGHAKALVQAFLWPFVILAAFLFAPTALQLTRAIAAGEMDQAFGVLAQSMFALLFLLRLAMDLLALCWFGMALALTLRKPSLSPALNVLFVLVLPSILSFCMLDIFVDIFFISWGIAKLQKDLRILLVEQYQSAPSSLFKPTAPPNLRAPPVIRG